VLDDADLEMTVEACVKGRLINTGQSCIAAKRFIVQESVYQQFEELFVAKMQQQKMGDPLDPASHYGPLAHKSIREELHRQVCGSIAKGARLLTGGNIPIGRGSYYPATVLGNVTPGMPAYHEELFGPVAALIKVRDDKEAIQIANDTSFGLGAAIFSANIGRARAMAENQLESGSCFINEFTSSDPRLPFGGVKESGIGRELSLYGILEFVNIKTIYIK
jgi:NAD-dependent aldehyde dehydrogenases